MKIVERRDINGWDSWSPGGGSVSISVQTDVGKHGISIMAGEPEDATFNRDLSDILSISDLLTLAYEAGARGESFDYELIDESDEEEDE